MRDVVRAISTLRRLMRSFASEPRLTAHALANMDSTIAAHSFADRWKPSAGSGATEAAPLASNPLLEYFEAHHTGPGILKWTHYFDLYHHHFQRFVGAEVHMVEVGIYSGGSLELWKRYFGPRLHLYGVDIEPACRAYESDQVQVFIGDQADRTFWREFRARVPRIDIVLDDGGHQHHQQIVTLEELLPHVSPGGVYVCEDIHGVNNGFGAYAAALSERLHALPGQTPFQQSIDAVHLYPYVTVIERSRESRPELHVERRGTEWQPFEIMNREK